MIKDGFPAGLKPHEIRSMIPKDVWLCFQGWNMAHAAKKPGSDAPTKQQYDKLMERVRGRNS